MFTRNPFPKGIIMDEDGKLIGGLSFGMRKEPAISYYAKADGSKTVYELSYDFLRDLPKPEGEEEEKKAKQ